MRGRVALLGLLLASCVDMGADYGHLSAGDDRELPPPFAGDSVPDLGWEAQSHDPRLDIPAFEVLPCEAMDILFVVDNSGSMSDNHEKLVAEVPGFVDRLTQIGLGIEGGMHVGVVTTDSYRQNAEGCQSLGAMVTEVQFQTCGPYEEGLTYMTEADSLDEAFTCAASVGTQGDGAERPLDALLEALGPWHNRPGGCNDGFSRAGVALHEGPSEERAALVVVFVTDEDDTHTIGEPWEWVEYLKWLRGGSLEDAAFLGLLGGEEVCNEQEPERLREFLDLVPYSYEGSICGDDYEEFFADAIDFVATGCGNSFLPEG